MENARRKIVYIDDVKFGLITVKNMLKDRYEVFPAQSDTVIFDIFSNITPDLILLDIKVSVTTISESLTKLKQDKRYTDIPIVLITPGDDKENPGMALNPIACVSKPFATETLIETIENAFKLSGQKHGFAAHKNSTEKPCILAIDDVASVLKAIHHALRDKYKVYTLSNPEQLDEYLQEAAPDLFLLDYKMPEISGFDLIPIIRKYPEYSETPIIFLSSEGSPDYMSAASKLGVCDYIVKPFEPADLHEKIVKHLKR
jgi:PleD family two-component response regulator